MERKRAKRTYLGFSLLLACLSAFDELAYSSFYPLIRPSGCFSDLESSRGQRFALRV